MDSVDLYQVVGGRGVCRQLSEAFYARVKRDPVLRPLFPGKSMRCAVEAFAAFLAQFLGGPAEDAQARWWLSLRESRFKIGSRERQAWMSNMIEALEDVPIEEPIRLALRDLFERSSAYIVNTGQGLGEPAAPENPSDDRIHREIAQRWAEQHALDDLVTAIRDSDAGRGLELARSPALKHRFARDRAVLAHVLGLMMGCGNDALLEYAERELLADPALADIRSRYGRTLLHDASAQGNLRMVELLLRIGAEPNGKTSGERTPLYCVANECHVAGGGHIVRALVRAGAQVDARSGAKGCTALHMAARRGNTEVAEALVDCGADINARDKAGDTPLQRAKNCRKSDVALLLVSRGADARLSPRYN
ncbi:MAG TPA: ankyrin repeat domain-containing protein [Bryobacteraceae bacterium]|jgi:truncated hemoglobin YjbI|nr:ankyrin repeat domain-containing protein [Bryobacteraceae bacterium]